MSSVPKQAISKANKVAGKRKAPKAVPRLVSSVSSLLVKAKAETESSPAVVLKNQNGTAATAKNPAPITHNAQNAKKRRAIQTVVATGDESISALLSEKKRKINDYEKKRKSLCDGIDRIEKRLKGLKRTRRNVKTYNSLIEQRDALTKNLAVHEAEKPDTETFFNDLKDFIDQNKTLEEEQNKTSDKVHKEQSEPCEKAPTERHRAATVTSGAPIFDLQQIALLRIARSDIEQRMRKQLEGDLEQSHSARASARMNAMLAKSLRSLDAVERTCMPIAFVLSPFGSGKVMPCSREQIESTRELLATIDAPKEQCNDDGNGSAHLTNKTVTVTIGKRKRDDGKSAGSSSNNQSTRLDVKMKDLRNLTNVSISNFLTVRERKKTSEEVQHDNFKDFLAKRAEQQEKNARPQYEDGLCESCGGELDVDVHAGMVTCTKCGATYSDGIDAHQWYAVPHIPHSKFRYLRSGHLLSLLKRFQGKEKTVIPRDVIDRVVLRLHQEKYDLREIGYKEMKYVLQKLLLARYYEHVWQLLHIATGREPWRFTEKEEIEFQVVFDVLERVYPLFKPAQSENFIFYWYFIKKSAQLLGHPDHVVAMFPLLKSSRLHNQKERIWKKMVEHVGWPYYVTYHAADSRKLMGL